MNYDDYLKEKVNNDGGFGALAIPVVGWILSAYFFGVHYPITYMFRKRAQHLCPDCQKAADKKNVSKKKSHGNTLR